MTSRNIPLGIIASQNLSANVEGGGSYVQNRVATTGASISTNSGNEEDRPFLEFSVWINPTAQKTTGMFAYGLDTYVSLGNTGRIFVRVERQSTLTPVLELATPDDSYVSGALQHIYFSYDLAAGDYVLLVDGVDPGGTPSIGPTSVAAADIEANKILDLLTRFNNTTTLMYEGEVADFWLDAPASLHGYSAFVDGAGDPKDISGLAAPHVFLGGTYVASNWNAEDNQGTLPLTLDTGSFTDV